MGKLNFYIGGVVRSENETKKNEGRQTFVVYAQLEGSVRNPDLVGIYCEDRREWVTTDMLTREVYGFFVTYDSVLDEIRVVDGRGKGDKIDEEALENFIYYYGDEVRERVRELFSEPLLKCIDCGKELEMDKARMEHGKYVCDAVSGGPHYSARLIPIDKYPEEPRMVDRKKQYLNHLEMVKKFTRLPRHKKNVEESIQVLKEEMDEPLFYLRLERQGRFCHRLDDIQKDESFTYLGVEPTTFYKMFKKPKSYHESVYQDDLCMNYVSIFLSFDPSFLETIISWNKEKVPKRLHKQAVANAERAEDMLKDIHEKTAALEKNKVYYNEFWKPNLFEMPVDEDGNDLWKLPSK